MVVGRPNCRSNKRQSFLVVILISAKLPGSRVRTPGDSRVGIPAKSGMKVDGGLEKNQKMKRIAREKNKKKSQGEYYRAKERKSESRGVGITGWRDGWMARRSVGGTSRRPRNASYGTDELTKEDSLGHRVSQRRNH